LKKIKTGSGQAQVNDMGQKGDNTQLHIASEARKLFARSGFSKITMKDVCEAAGISRGGLYKYFSSTGEIFARIVRAEEKRGRDALEDAINNNVDVEKVFRVFIDSRLSYISDPDMNIDHAFHEYAANDPEGMILMREYIADSIRILAGILDFGRGQGVFGCDDAVSAAKHILWLLEGMGIHNSIIPLTEEEVSGQRKMIFAYVGLD